MLAVFVNCAAIIAGSIIGMLFRKKITEELSGIVCSAAGIVTLVIGFQMAFEYKSIIVLALSLIGGGILGTWWNIDGNILSLGKLLQRRFSLSKPDADGNKNSNFAYAFLNSSVLFCVGAMAIIGSFKAGIHKDYTLIFTKSILDGFMAIVFTAAMGIGTAFSAICILVYQGLLTIASTWIAPYISETMLTEISAAGGALIIMIGINLLNLRTIKTANYLPAVALAAIFTAVQNLW